MASLARLFLWKPSCHGNTACLVELEMSSSFLRPSIFGLFFSPLLTHFQWAVSQKFFHP